MIGGVNCCRALRCVAIDVARVPPNCRQANPAEIYRLKTTWPGPTRQKYLRQLYLAKKYLFQVGRRQRGAKQVALIFIAA